MNVLVAESNHHKDLTGTSTSTVDRHEHLITHFAQSGHEVVSATGPVVYFFDRFGDRASVGVVVEVKFDVTLIAECHHTYLYLVWSDIESTNDVD